MELEKQKSKKELFLNQKPKNVLSREFFLYKYLTEEETTKNLLYISNALYQKLWEPVTGKQTLAAARNHVIQRVGLKPLYY